MCAATFPNKQIMNYLALMSHFEGNQLILKYGKSCKYWDIYNSYHNCPKNLTVWFSSAAVQSRDADGMANSVDPDQTAPLGAV